ncbi:MAG TPA: hypothetical protein VJI98_00195 [Candidatus Nanoarchaeia archaeon]|nr:hypothetical protein [Candidatus Nanoarchaeia archaeon]
MNNLEDVFIENDKINAPFLLASSYNGLVKFTGSHIQNGILYWYFTPKEKAKLLIDQLRTKTEPRIPAQDIFSAIETFWQQVAEMRGKG